MAKEKIEEIIGKGAFDQLERLKKLLIENVQHLKDNVDIAKAFEKALSASNSVKEVKTNVDNLTKANEALSKSEAKIEALKQQKIKTDALLANLATKQAQAAKAQNAEAIQQQKENERLINVAIKQAKEKATADAKAEKNTKDLSNAYKQLRKEHVELSNEAKSLGIQFGRNSQQYIDAKNKANELRKSLFAVESDLKEYQRNVGNYPTTIGGFIRQVKNDFTDLDGKLTFSTGNFKQFAETASIAVAGFSLISLGAKAAGKSIAFEDSANNLEAITGASGEALEKLKKTAIETSNTTKFTSVETLESLKLIGSAKPELLNDIDALIAVKDASVLLAQATGSDLPTSVKNLTDILNQYGAGADQASLYVDALAAASKFGAAEVPEVAAALIEFGAAAKASNVNVYESAGAIELLAEKGIKGTEAGTKLRNILINLSAAEGLPKEALAALDANGVSTKILTDNSLSLQDRLTELSKIKNDAVALEKVFGKENIISGQIVLNNIDRYADLAAQIKTTGVAQEQANTNTKGASNAVAELKNKFDNLLTSSAVNTVIRVFATGLAMIISNAPLALTLIGSLGVGFAYLAIQSAIASKQGLIYQGILALQAIQARAKIAIDWLMVASQTAITAAVRITTFEFTIFNNVIKVSPIGAFITLLLLAVTAFKSYAGSIQVSTKAITENSEAKRLNKEAEVEAQSAIQETITKEQVYISTIKDRTNSDQVRGIALQNLINLNPEYLRGLTLDNIETKQGIEIINKYNASLKQMAIEKAKSAIASREFDKLTKLEISLNDVQTSIATKSPLSLENIDQDFMDKSVEKTSLPFFKSAVLGVGKFLGATVESPELKKTLETGLKAQIEKQRTVATAAANNAGKTTPTESTETTKSTGSATIAKKEADAAAKERATANKKAIADVNNANEAAAKATIDNLKKEQDAYNELLKASLDADSTENKDIIENEKSTLAEKLQALEYYYFAKQSISSIEKQKEIDAAEKNAKIIDSINVKYGLKDVENIKEKAKLRQSIIDKAHDVDFAAVIKNIDAITEKQDAINAKAVQDLQDQYIAGTISREDYESQLNNIVRKGAIERLEIQLDEAKKALAIANLSPEEKEAIKKRVDDISKNLSNEKVNQKNDFKTPLQLQAESFEKDLKKYKEYQDAILEITNTISNAVFDAEVARIEKKSKAQSSAYELEKKAIEGSSFSALEKNRLLKKLDAEKALQDKNNERERITAERKKAIADKVGAAFQIGINTAIAVTKAIGASPVTLGLPWSAIVATLGAVQLAAVLAKPLPQYAKGRDGGKAEQAIVGEQGSELRIKKDGGMSLTPNIATVTWLEEGEKIIPAHKVNNYLKSNIKAGGIMHYDETKMFNDQNIVNELILTRKAIAKLADQNQSINITNNVGSNETFIKSIIR
jgi:TP901 family phage tail tape measure protein